MFGARSCESLFSQWRGSKFVDADAGHSSFRNHPKMVVVGQVYDLSEQRHLPENLERLLRPEIVEGLHDVVGNEWYGWPDFGELSITGRPKRQIELEACSFRQVGCKFGAAVRAQRHQDVAVLARLCRQPAIGAPADQREGVRSLRHHGATVLVSIRPQCPVGRGDAKAQTKVLARFLLNLEELRPPPLFDPCRRVVAANRVDAVGRLLAGGKELARALL